MSIHRAVLVVVFLILYALVLGNGCKDTVESYRPPIADFTADVQTGHTPLTVQFLDMSEYASNSWLWSFGDGTPDSTERNPSHTYTDAGVYTVTLTVNGPGGQCIEVKTDFITVKPGWSVRSPFKLPGIGFPQERAGHAIAYDPVREVSVLFGGNKGGNETWEWDGTLWTNVSPQGIEGVDFPTARLGHKLVYDSSRGIIVLFGGWRNSHCSDTWEWDGNNWINVSPTGTEGADFPSARMGHAMMYDSVREVVILFGGIGSAIYGDTWEWNGTNWTNVSPAGTAGVDYPTPRLGSTMDFNTVNEVATLFGGYDGSYCNDTWEWDGTSWADVSPTGTEGVDFPSGRLYHTVVQHSGDGVLVLFGGLSSGNLSDTWEWNGSTWSEVSPGGTEGLDFPTSRYYHAISYDSDRDIVVLFGGNDGKNRDDTWEWDSTNWINRSPQGKDGLDFPSARYGHAMAYDNTHGVTVLFGGNVLTDVADTWAWDGSSWTDVSPAGTAGVDFPTARHGHVMAYDSIRDVIVLFGGDNGSGTKYADTWEWNGISWTDVSPSGTEGTDYPSARHSHAMAFDIANAVVVLFGGNDGNSRADTWHWDGTNWTDVSPSGTDGVDFPSARSDHAIAFDSSRSVTVLFGGEGINVDASTWEWNGTSWANKGPSGLEGVDFPYLRKGHALTYDSTRGMAVLFGGNASVTWYSDTWGWDGTGWTTLSPGGTEQIDFPCGREEHAMVYDSTRKLMVLFGGYDKNLRYADTWEF